MPKKIITTLILTLVLIFGYGPFLATAAQDQIPTSLVNTADPNYAQGTYGVNDFIILAIRASRMLLGIVGSLTLVMFIYGGVMFLISAGSAEAVGKAKKIIVAAVVGLIIVFSSYLIIQFVLKAMGLNWNGAVAQPTVTLNKNQIKTI
jgi:hypothetical protein